MIGKMSMDQNQVEKNQIIETDASPEIETVDLTEEPEIDEIPSEDDSMDDEELVYSFEGQAPDPETDDNEDAPSWVKELRKKHRESERQKRILQKKLEDAEAKLQPKVEALPDKPKFEDFAYDEDKFDAALQEWHSKKLKHDANQQLEQEKAEAVQKQFNDRLEAYQLRKSEIAHNVDDMQEAEELVTALLDETKQSILLTASDDPAQLIYALGKNPKKLQDLASIDDPIRFTAEAAKLEAKMKITRRTPSTSSRS